MEPTESFHQRRLVSNLVVENFKSSSDADVKHTLFWRFRRRDTEFCAYIRRLLQNPLFNSIMISIISLNAVFLALETDYAIKLNSYAYLELADLIIISIYTTEILLKFYVDPLNYWRSGYNLFDVLILLIACLPYTIDKNDIKHYRTWDIINGFQALKILKLISYSRGMRKTSEYKTFSELVEDFKKTLHHSDPMVLEDFCASIPFIDLYLTSLDLQDNTVYRLQELYYELVGTLNSILEDVREKSVLPPEKDMKS
ncbi:cation channel sperm-associated protein 3 [Terrapene carolina triunguis]|uniref:cation channel sperm-associated protein 3 n=1 Tax=Terrapene triunguis TaxID=2587831 RepID=UPI000CEF7A03|nr:cation channel sperm-associated protein 3 [Terrapene carolina triunguis]